MALPGEYCENFVYSNIKNIKFRVWSFNSILHVAISTNGDTRNLSVQIMAPTVRKVWNVMTGITKSATANVYEAPSKTGYCKQLVKNMC
jgi:hypothetical protein